MRDSKPQRCVQQHKSLEVTGNATNQDKHIYEASKQFLPAISSRYHGNTRKVCYSIGRFVSMSSTYKLIANVYVF